MFTGIVTDLGRVRAITRLGDTRFEIETHIDMAGVAIGASIACSGACLTVIEKGPDWFAADVSAETLSCSIGLDAAGEVNLEKSLRLSDRLGGHMVSGHVDGVGEVLKFEPVGESMLLRVRAPDALARYIAQKGSIAIHGVSLTVNHVEGPEFAINLIPHTVSVTTLKYLKPGSKVNLEVDMIARYVERMLGAS